MLFNSLLFLLFAALFVPAYFAARGRGRLLVCLIGSYIFYGSWDWRYLAIIFFHSAVNFYFGKAIAAAQTRSTRKQLLVASIVVNLMVLGFFKYFDFFSGSLEAMFDTLGLHASFPTLNIVLPIAISYYTFQTMSYTIDLYRGQIEAETSFLRFATYVAFFPKLLAGPIVRARELLPQFRKDQPFDWNQVMLGLGQVLLGFFKKVVIADSLAPLVDDAFAHPEAYGSLSLAIAVVFFAFQIYCDFSGYSDIAIGFARILGYRFPANFNLPYFSKSFSEFWTRWHISLSSWLRDYLYFTLIGRRRDDLAIYRSHMITMLLCGLWHGPRWTYVFSLGLHGVYLVLQRVLAPGYDRLTRRWLPEIVSDAFLMLLVFTLTCVAWLFFRSPTFESSLTMIQGIVALDDLSLAAVKHKVIVAKGFLLIALLLAGEALSLRVSVPKLVVESPAFRTAAFAFLLWLMALLGTFEGDVFIYQQF